MRVRSAVKEDIDGILNLLLQVDMVHHEGRPDIFKGPATKYDRDRLRSILIDGNSPVFVYDDDGFIAGHAFCIHKQIKDDPVLTDIETLYIDDICVDAAYRGKGVGRALFDHVREYAVNNKYYNITLNVWACNPGAMAFYESLGLKPQKIGMEMLL